MTTVEYGTVFRQDGSWFGRMNEDAYHAVAAVSSSILRALSDPETGPSDARARFDKPSGPASDAMRLGSLLHLLVLEPRRVGEIEVVSSTPTAAERRRASVFQKFGFAAPQKRLDSRVATIAERLDLDGAARAALEKIKPLLDDTRERWCESSGMWVESGVVCKMRADLLQRTRSGVLLGIDCKWTSRPIGQWRRRAMDSGLLLQAAHYAEGALRLLCDVERPADLEVAELDRRFAWLFVVVEAQPPHRVRMHIVRGSALRVAMDLRYELVEEFSRRLRANDWSDPKDGSIEDLCSADEAWHALRRRRAVNEESEG